MQQEFPQQVATELVQLMKQSMIRIQHCVDQLNHDQVWWQPATGQHSVGILLRHITGNLKQWAVDGILQQPDDRNRAAEFESTQRPTTAQLLADLNSVCEQVQRVINEMSDDDWLQQRMIQGFEVTVTAALMHTIPHLVGHTHQITLLTRMQLLDDYEFQWNENSDRSQVPL